MLHLVGKTEVVLVGHQQLGQQTLNVEKESALRRDRLEADRVGKRRGQLDQPLHIVTAVRRICLVKNATLALLEEALQ